jgi:hypothetical protein
VHNEFTPMDHLEEDNNEVLVMILLYTSWMTHPGPLKRHIHLLMLNIRMKQ